MATYWLARPQLNLRLKQTWPYDPRRDWTNRHS